MQPLLKFTVTFAVAFAVNAITLAQDEAPSFAPTGDESANFHSEIVLKELDNPVGLVVRDGPVGAGPHELFIAESGAGRIIRISTEHPEKVSDAITGFPMGTFGKNPSSRVGPLGMTLLTRTKLVIGGGGHEAGKNLLGVYALPIGGSPITAEAVDHSVGPLAEKVLAKVGHDQFLAMAKTEDSLFVVTGGNEQTGWILKSGIEANHLSLPKPFIQIDKANQAGAPTSIAITPKTRPRYLVVSQMGSKVVANDSSISFFVPTSGGQALSLGTGLHDIYGLAYSSTGNLYAVDISWQDEQLGGVYRLDDARFEGKQACQAVKIASVVKPTGLAFTPDGTLYVTAFGLGDNNKQGVLVKITGKF